MIKLGLTGGIGSGKSAAADAFARLGAHVVRADDLAKQLMAEDPALRAALIEAFGPDTYRPDGSLDRTYLAGQVFGDPAELARLNGLVHPAVRDAFPRQVAEAEQAGAPLFVYETAILFEAGAQDRFDRVAVVDAPLETRVARVMARDGVDREAVLARLGHQLPAEELRTRADVVLDNSGDLAHLDAQVAGLFRRLTEAG